MWIIYWNKIIIGTQVHHPYTKIINDFKFYAEGYHHDIDIKGNRVKHHRKSYDSIWVNNVICRVASNGFNHVKNFCGIHNRNVFKKKEIVEGFLVLDCNNDKLSFPPPVDTVDEMFKKYYNVN